MDSGETIEALIGLLDDRQTDLDCFDISSQFEAWRKRNSSRPSAEVNQARAEEIAFALCEDSGGKDSKTHYGPQVKLRTTEGKNVIWPDVTTLESETIDYWSERSRAAGNPFLRARYADIVWDLTFQITGKKPSVVFAQSAIDSSLEAVRRKMFEWPIAAENSLRRALSLSLSIGDNGRATLAIAAIISLDDALAEENGRRFAFDLWLANPRIPLSSEQAAKLVGDMEADLVSLGEQETIIPVVVEASVKSLLKYYRRSGDRENEHRILLLYRAIIEKAPGRIFPMVASSGLHSVHRALTDAGLQEEAEAMLPLMSKVDAEAFLAMTPISTSFEIPMKQIDEEIGALIDGDLPTVFGRCAREFVPDRVRAERWVKEAARDHPMMGMFKVELHDDDGRPIASIGSVDDDLEGRTVISLRSELDLIAPFLRMTMERMAAKFALTPDLFVGFLEGSAFDPKRAELVRRGLAAYLGGDYQATLCILVPEVEAALRRLARLSGISVVKRSRLGGLDLKNLGDLLSEPKVAGILSDQVTTYFRVLLTDRRGWNLRNSVSHGLLEPSAMGSHAADRIVHVVLVLGCFRRCEKPSA